MSRPVSVRFSVVGAADLPNPLTVSLYAEPLMPLLAGEQAVIDVDPICAAPCGDPSLH